MAKHIETSLETLLADLRNHRTRAAARRGLAAHGNAAAAALTELLGDPEAPENARWAAMTLLAECRHEPAAPLLIEICRHEQHLRGEAVRALRAITGMDVGEDPEAWERALSGAAPEARTEPEAPDTARHSEAILNLFRHAVEAHAETFAWMPGTPGYLHLCLPLENGRKHQIVVTFDTVDANDQPLATFYTECGPAVDGDMAFVAGQNATTPFGTFALEADAGGNRKVTMRHAAAIESLTPAVIAETLKVMAAAADEVEHTLTGGDNI